MFGNESFFYNVTADAAPSPSFEADLKAKLNGVGGELLAFSSEGATLQLCSGHAVTVRNKQYYLDIAMAVPGGHDAYDGALGQTFQCKYVVDHEDFVWSSAQEESFRLPNIFTPSGAFEVNSTCPDPLGGHRRKAKAGQMKHSASKLFGKSVTGDKAVRL